MRSELHAKLVNWGEWLKFESEIGPHPVRAVSLESRYIPEAGDVFDDEPISRITAPCVADAEAMQRLISGLELMMQYALAVRYAGYPAVMRMRRVGEHAMVKLADNGEIILCELMRKRA